MKLIYLTALALLICIIPSVTNAETVPATKLAQAGSLPQALCSDPSAVADFYNVPYPAQNSPALNSLIGCIKTNIPNPAMIDMDQIYTFQLNPSLINFTRGVRDCGLDTLCASLDCHTAYSCHYGGRTGQVGAEAADFNARAPYSEDQLFSAIRTLVYPGGACFGQAKYVILEGDHTHISTNSDVGCDATNIPSTAPEPSEPAATTTQDEITTPASFIRSALFNPISCGDPMCIITKILRMILGTFGITALTMFMFGGFTILTSGGNVERVGKGKKIIVYAAIGLIIVLLSWSIVYIVSTKFF
ncbi:MAG: pilin [Patescibacteria group bacterium]